MTAPLHPKGLLRAARVLTIAMTGVLALLCAAATMRAAEQVSLVATPAVTASDDGDTTRALIADRAGVDTDDAFDDAVIHNERASGSTAVAVNAARSWTVHRSEGIGIQPSERPPRG